MERAVGSRRCFHCGLVVVLFAFVTAAYQFKLDLLQIVVSSPQTTTAARNGSNETHEYMDGYAEPSIETHETRLRNSTSSIPSAADDSPTTLDDWTSHAREASDRESSIDVTQRLPTNEASLENTRTSSQTVAADKPITTSTLNNATTAKEARIPAENSRSNEPVFDDPATTIFNNATVESMKREPTKKKNNCMFGFYMQAHKQPKATLEVLTSIRSHMPDAPIYLLSSAGYHYDPLVERFSILKYVYDKENVEIPKGQGNLTRWFSRLEAAAQWCPCEYLVIMEDDVLLRFPLNRRPKHDAGGSSGGTPWSVELVEKFPIVANWSHTRYGLCGGSYIRVEAYLDAWKRTNWSRLVEMGEFMPGISTFNDMTLGAIMMDAGYSLRPWDQFTEGNRKRQQLAPLKHREKQYYNVLLTKEDGLVVLEDLNVTIDVPDS